VNSADIAEWQAYFQLEHEDMEAMRAEMTGGPKTRKNVGARLRAAFDHLRRS
jgi:hypothetical protein